MQNQDSDTIKYVALGAGAALLGGLIYLGITEAQDRRNNQQAQQNSSKKENPKQKKSDQPKIPKILSKFDFEEILKRRKLFKKNNTPEYAIFLSFEEGSDKVFLRVVIDFQLEIKSEIFLDYNGSGLQSVQINQKNINLGDLTLSQGKITIPQKFVSEGLNTIEIQAEIKLATGQLGLELLKGAKGVWAVNNNLRISNWLPGFFQSDIKMIQKIIVRSPESWKVISNSKESTNQEQIEELKNQKFYKNLSNTNQETGYKFTNFLISRKIPSRGLFLLAGEVESVKSKKGYKLMKPELHFRKEDQALIENMKKSLFEFQLAALKSIYNLTKSKYMFPSLETVFLETNEDAHNYAGIIVIPIKLLRKAEQSVEAAVRLEREIFRQMVQMWFGQFVSENSWTDVFVKQSIANYISSTLYKKYISKKDRKIQIVNDLIDRVSKLEMYKMLIDRTLKQSVTEFQNILTSNDHFEKQNPHIFDIATVNRIGVQALERIEKEIGQKQLLATLIPFLKMSSWGSIAAGEVIDRVNNLHQKNLDLDLILTEFDVSGFDPKEFSADQANLENACQLADKILSLAKNVLIFKKSRTLSLELFMQTAIVVLADKGHILYNFVSEVIKSLGVLYSHAFMAHGKFLETLVTSQSGLLYETFGNKLSLLPEKVSLDPIVVSNYSTSEFKNLVRTLYSLGFADKLGETSSGSPVQQEIFEEFLKRQPKCDELKQDIKKLAMFLLKSEVTSSDWETFQDLSFKMHKNKINELLNSLYEISSQIQLGECEDLNMTSEKLAKRWENILNQLSQSAYHIVGVWLYSILEIKKEKDKETFVYRLLKKHCSIYASRN